jgi:tRNA threonylcarbamoyl adenosine modification protein YjeE
LAAIELDIRDQAAMEQLAEDVAVCVRLGDMIALSGPLGAGKSTFARALVRALCDDPELDVPSPTFTLVQAYEGRLPVAHFDLYRLGDPDELAELGLDEAVQAGVVLVEWPERGGDWLPEDRIRLSIEDGSGPSARHVQIKAPDEFQARLSRTLSIRRFLEGTRFAGAHRRFLLGDASVRAYERVEKAGLGSAILMNAPARPIGPVIRDGKRYTQIAHLAESVEAFVAIGRWLHENRLGAPEIFDADLRQGLLLIEDLGAEGIVDAQGRPVEERYEEAVLRLAELHRLDVPPRLPVDATAVHEIAPFDTPAILIEVEQLLDWYLEFGRGYAASKEERQDFLSSWNMLARRMEQAEASLLLRDYHSPNILWRPERSGRDRIAIIDFQDAMIGPAAYDVASLVRDARVTVPADMAERLLTSYVSVRQADDAAFDETAFREALAIASVQRNTKILGIFVRLDRRDGKPAYLRHLPRIRSYLREDLAHPALGELSALYERLGVLNEPSF